MAVTATNGSNLAWGYVKFTPPTLTQTGLIHLDVASAIASDVAGTIAPDPGDLDILFIAWTFYFYGTQILSNSYLLKSALPKYDLGWIDIAFRGSVSDSFYLNYLAQRSPVYYCWKNNSGTAFPSPYIPPDPFINDPGLTALPLSSTPAYAVGYDASIKYGTDIYLQFTGLQISDETELTIYYQSYIPGYGAPLSLGDI